MQAITISKVATTERHRCRGRRAGATTTVSLGTAAVAWERRLATSARSCSSSARSSALKAAPGTAVLSWSLTLAPSLRSTPRVITRGG